MGRWWTLAVVMLLIAGAAFTVVRRAENDGEKVACAGGEAGEEEAEREADGPSSDLFTGPGETELPCGETPGHPESFAELARVNGAIVARSVAPGVAIKAGAYRAAIHQRAALPTIGNAWKSFGTPPLISYKTEFDTTSGSTRLGLGDLSGRVADLARGGDGALYAAVSNGGVWKSTDAADNWTPIGDGLPTQVIGSVALADERIVALTGDNAFGGNTYAGLGAYYSDDGGRNWTHAGGIPDGLLGFQVAVDPTDASKLYAATGGGLFRSTDRGATWTNANLPTGKNAPAGTPDCSGKPTRAKDCFLANVVTDVVVQGADNAQTPDGGKPGAVLAAVGWRAGTKPNADGAQQSPGNGIYLSDTGAPGTFTNMDFAGNSTPTTDPLTQARIGRVELGIATGADQNHRIVYAVVQDAVEFNGGVIGLDANENGLTSAAQPEVLNGIWVTTDFGASWRQLEGSTALSNDPTSGSALSPPVCRAPAVIAYCPGVQAWYNQWIAPDPTRQTAAGVPTRLAFGLEEIWSNTGPLQSPTGLDGNAPVKFSVVGRYYAGETCTILNATNGLPVCPAAPGGQVPAFTTHPDQHSGLWLPEVGGAATLFVANDGGVYKQLTGAGEDLSNDGWGQGKPQGHSGANAGLRTLQPYDASMAKDGTVYMGLQDNGEVKIEPDGTMYTIYGGDGFFSAVDPDNSKVAYEEYVAGAVSVTEDGGKTWKDIAPTLTSAQFSTPFEMDPNDAGHLVIGGRNVAETTAGPATGSGAWANVFDLGTRERPGDAAAASSGEDPDNQLSAVSTLSYSAGDNAPIGNQTKNFGYTGGAATIPGGGDQTGLGVFLPGSYDDHPFKIARDEGNASARISIKWGDANYDWDLYLLDADGAVVASSAEGGTTEETVNVPNPRAGDYTIRVVNFAALGTFDATVDFTPRTEALRDQTATYVGYCGYCDTITQGTPFASGVATNVGGKKPAVAGKPDGWHIATAKGLPERYVTSVRMDPQDPKTVYATLAGYGRRWAFPGAVGEDISGVGTGHVFRSTDAGATFTDVSGDLPDTPANWSVLHNGHLVVGTDIGVFESCDSSGGAYSRLGTNLPTTPVSTIRYKPGDADTIVVATYGRGVYTYTFGADDARCRAQPGAPGPQACKASKGFKSVTITPEGNGLRFDVERALDVGFTATVYQRSRGRRVYAGRQVAVFRDRTGSFGWKGKRGLTAGLYSVRVRIRTKRLFDVRQATFALLGGRFKPRPRFATAESCSVLRSATLSGPAFGGVRRSPLTAAFRLRDRGRARVSFSQRGEALLVRTVKVAGGELARVKLPARRARAGDVRVTLAVRAGRARKTVGLTARRLR